VTVKDRLLNVFLEEEWAMSVAEEITQLPPARLAARPRAATAASTTSRGTDAASTPSEIRSVKDHADVPPATSSAPATAGP